MTLTRALFALLLFAASALPAAAQEYYDIGVDLPQYPEMQPISDSPVYYAPAVDSNYFYYDGNYWDYANDGWYTSPWYNGPWTYVDPIYVPTYVLWVPVAYYRRPPYYFRHWHANQPPHWAEHWGRNWQAQHNAIYGRPGNRGTVRAPLPDYQRRYTRANYPRPQQQAAIHAQNYSYRPQATASVRHGGNSHQGAGNLGGR